MGLARAEVHLAAATNLPEDGVVNTFWFSTLGTPPTFIEAGLLADRLAAFYLTIPAGDTRRVSTYIGESISRGAGAHEVRVYDGEVIGPPIRVVNFSIAAPEAPAQLPTEMAVALTFHADLTGVPEFAPGPTRPRARRRGRVYIGPLTHTANVLADFGAPNYWVLVAQPIRDTLRRAAMALVAANDTSQWIVHSRAGHAGSSLVVGGWVDDAFDVQRRRGQRRVGRDLWPF